MVEACAAWVVGCADIDEFDFGFACGFDDVLLVEFECAVFFEKWNFEYICGGCARVNAIHAKCRRTNENSVFVRFAEEFGEDDERFVGAACHDDLVVVNAICVCESERESFGLWLWVAVKAFKAREFEGVLIGIEKDGRVVFCDFHSRRNIAVHGEVVRAKQVFNFWFHSSFLKSKAVSYIYGDYRAMQSSND